MVRSADRQSRISDSTTRRPAEDRGVDAVGELLNLQEIASYLRPTTGSLPTVQGMDVAGVSVPLHGNVGGDHIIYLDFKKRHDLKARIADAEATGHHHIAEKLRLCQSRAGVVVADVSGHFMTDALLTLMLHQAFLLGAIYELDLHGEVTTRLFENLNKRFYQSSAVNKYLTLLYGEISQDGKFRFITAGHPFPVVFSRYYDRIVGISEESLSTFPPIG
ncbi:MAG: SpoIIE family protein phosphatase, partial [Acidobacteriota bacterium]